jgi:hypothetical protein
MTLATACNCSDPAMRVLPSKKPTRLREKKQVVGKGRDVVYRGGVGVIGGGGMDA